MARVAVKPPQQQDPGNRSTPTGASFYRLFNACPRRWFYRYELGLVPDTTPDYLLLGSVYHAIHEGLTRKQIATWPGNYVSQYEGAATFYRARMKDGPPLPKAQHKERLHQIVLRNTKGSAPFTSRPDREEILNKRKVVRDFKAWRPYLGQSPEIYWSSHPEIVGEILAADAHYGIVDLITKAKEPKVYVFQVGRDERKEEALTNDCVRAANYIRGVYKKPKEEAFEQSLHGCFLDGFKCPYHGKCFGGGAWGGNFIEKKDHRWKELML